jgi:predicted Zn-dependent protease
LTTFAACVTTPVTHRKQLNFMPDSEMNALGAQAYAEMRQKEKISTNQALTANVDDVGRHIATASGQHYNWEFTLFDDKQVNAFCLPGGKVGVFTGIIPVAQNNAALAAVLGHEVAHAVLKHSAERASQQLLLTGGMMALDVAMRDSHMKQLLFAAIGIGSQVGITLPFSRKQEAEADAVGLRYMAKAGYDPKEAIALWDRMGKLGGTPPEILSDHPDPKSRAKALEAQLPDVMPLYEASQKVPTQPL